LISVAERFIADIEIPGHEDVKSQLAQHMAEEHLSVAKMSKMYFETQRRYNYVTPKSFLELISFFKHLLSDKRTKVHGLIDRLDVGLSTLRKTSNDVMELQKDLDITMKKVEEKKIATDHLINAMKMQQADAQVQDDNAKIEAQKANEESSNALMIEKEAEAELREAEPAMKAAAEAVNCLSKAMLTELKALSKPPSGVDMVTNSCLILIEKEYNPKKQNWNRAKAMMQNVDAFKNKLAEFKGEDITDQEITLLSNYIQHPNFSPEKMISKSAAAANLCTWVVNIFTYNRIYVKVKPLMDSLSGARQKKESALSRLADAEKKVADVQSHLKTLEEKYNDAMREKQEVEDQAHALQNRANLAKRLVGGLASENVRWGQEIEKLNARAETLPGDCMLAAGFISYLGAFDQTIREELWKVQWSSDIVSRGIPLTVNSDPLDLLTDDENNSRMISEGLPSDRISLENGSIVTTCKRWPLIIDPQAQGIKWLKQKEEGNVDIIQLSQKNWIAVIQNAISNGRCVIIENLGSEIDATLDPVLSRAIYKKGRTLYLKFAGEEIEYDPAFQLYLQTKLSNPHYKPEIAAQCTIINFIATERGLEDQLLAKVVEIERSDLEEKAKLLMSAAMNYQMQLVQLEDDLLERLANAPDDILSDVALIEGLEATKQTAKEISQAVESGKKTQAEVEAAREAYRPQAAEGAMLYFILTKLNSINHMYQYSLDSFNSFFEKSIHRAEKKDTIEARVASLQESLRVTIFTWVSRGLFERHKLMFLAQITFNLMKRGVIGADQWSEEHFQFLLKAPTKNIEPNPLDWLPDNAWMAITALGEFDDFTKLSSDMVEASPRFREWFNTATPENEKLPLDWAALDRTPFLKLLVIRSIRPDRLISTLMTFIRKTLPSGSSYVDCDSTLNGLEILDQCLLDSTPTTPIYFILSHGANVVADLDVLAAKYGFQKGISYHNVSMGQGQDLVAMSWLETAHRNGHWVILNNVHLMPKWLIELEKKLDEYAVEGSHTKFRVFLTSDPSTTIPIGLLSRCIKITNEPPTGLKANLKRAWCFFSKDYIDDTDSKTRSILFGLCHFHSIMMERKTFGPLGFNMKYPFSIGDLRDSATCLQNYMDNSGGGKIPWQDLKYIFGEIMYGGHIVNDFDRLVANEYLNFFMKDELLDEMEMFPFVEEEKGFSFISPPPTSFEKYIEHIDAKLTQDTPLAFGLHPNAEIEIRTSQSNDTFRMLQDLQPKDAGSGESGLSSLHVAESVAVDILDKLGEKIFDVEELIRTLDDQGPYQNVFLQEMDIMNVLLSEIKRSIKELQLGLAGELTMSASMEDLSDCFYLDRVPTSWAKLAWASKRGLQSWIRNVLDRIAQLEEWSTNPGELPKVTKINLLVNPNSFLTAICQVTAQKKNWELDKLVTFTEVTKKTNPDDMDSSSRDGVYVTGFFLQGARWDTNNQQLEKCLPKEMYCPMPIINIRAVTREKANVGGIYHCPVYVTEERGPTYVFTTQLKTKSNPSRWVMAGVALLLDLSI
jgi:dynein heavy chain